MDGGVSVRVSVRARIRVTKHIEWMVRRAVGLGETMINHFNVYLSVLMRCC